MYERAMLHISHAEADTELLGPYHRFVIWVHGCCFDCAGCLAQNTRYGAFDEVSVAALSQAILASDCEGVTISGGEPFLQAGALALMIKQVRAKRDIGVIVYSGFTLAELQARPDSAALLAQTDLLIDGRYIRELDDGRPYIGSSNQQLHYLTDRYKAVGQTYYIHGKRRAEIKFTPHQAVLIGIPSENVRKVWQNIKQKGGGSQNDF